MRLPLRLLAAFVASVLIAFAALVPASLTARPAAKAPAAARQTVRPALWKVADGDTTIWLFGTIHALPARLPWLSGPIARALGNADELVTEIPETDPAQMQAAVIANAMLPTGQTLRGQLAPADAARLEQALAGFGLPPEAFDRFEPWYAAVALSTLPLAKQGYSADNGVDERIAAEMRARGKPRTGLETADDQLRMFDSLPAEVQTRYLHEVLESLPTLNRQLEEMVRAWQAGQADRLAELLNAEEDDPRMVQTLLTDRNRAWAGWVAKRLNRPGVVFMAVGAGHLAGKDSVQDMLRARGIAVARVQ
ncbi:TraB/GumN family protein [Novosphingobium piscinae]|uniref:TraB/GumN family protein n=1 Tax=Novosphingobium piscinae TaxID=1507448 RepID=A0A7X1KQD7_9SPHN|nr:TraB/GumN family protein [Novosphingobium piscinae]MBC2669418.1 TraB/GumN family protein [Novosphingobium piscinae]